MTRSFVGAANARARLIIAIEALREANDCRAPSVFEIRHAEQLVLDASILYARELHARREAARKEAS
jgi:hypothetical protein